MRAVIWCQFKKSIIRYNSYCIEISKYYDSTCTKGKGKLIFNLMFIIILIFVNIIIFIVIYYHFLKCKSLYLASHQNECFVECK